MGHFVDAYEAGRHTERGVVAYRRDEPAAVLARAHLRRLDPRAAHPREASAPPGSSVGFDVTGGQDLRVTVRVDGDGRGKLDRGADPDAAAVLRTSFAALARLACGRIDPAGAAVEVSGDAALGSRVPTSLTVTP